MILDKINNNRPAICDIGPLDLIGLSDQFDFNDRISVRNLWVKWIGKTVQIYGSTPLEKFGIVQYDAVNTFTYFAGCVASDAHFDHPDFHHLHIPTQTCLQFGHYGTPIGLRDTMEDIWANKIPEQSVTPIAELTVHKFIGVADLNADSIVAEIYIPIEA